MTYRDRLALTRMQHSSAPILIGPWLSELGFEVLYWLPFLAHLRMTYGLKKERLFAVSRGGAAGWYDVAGGLELYDYMPVQDLRLHLLNSFKQHKSMKQTQVSDWERTLIPHLAQRLGLRRYHVLHPSLMYQTFQAWWGNRSSLLSVAQQLPMGQIPVPPIPPELGLPESYVAVKFYDRPTFPMTEETKLWVQDLVARVSRKIPVVLLETGQSMDDHVDFPIPTSDRVVSLAGKMPARQNLALQSAVIKRSKAFIGTYGGMMQLAVRLGIPAAGFYSTFKDTAYGHKLLTEYLGTQLGQSVFIGRPQDASFVSQCLQELG
jgi:hypothetical protein